MIADTQHAAQSTQTNRTRAAIRTAAILLPAAFLFGSQIYSGIRNRVRSESNLQQATERAANPMVDVTHPHQAAPTEEVVLPGTMASLHRHTHLRPH